MNSPDHRHHAMSSHDHKHHHHHHGHHLHDTTLDPQGVNDLGGKHGLHDNHLHPSEGHGHGAMDHDAMGHGAMGHGVMDHGAMGHGAMGHGAMGHDDMGHMDMGHMQPVFKWVTDVPVLFQHWTTSTILELTLAMLAAAALAASYELLRNWLSSWDNTPRSVCTMPRWKQLGLRSFRSVMHALNASVGYLQMLFAMTYDLRIFVAIILGSGLGFFVLGPYFRRITLRRKRKRSGKSCQLREVGEGVAIEETQHFVDEDREKGDLELPGIEEEEDEEEQEEEGVSEGLDTRALAALDRETVL